MFSCLPFSHPYCSFPDAQQLEKVSQISLKHWLLFSGVYELLCAFKWPSCLGTWVQNSIFLFQNLSESLDWIFKQWNWSVRQCKALEKLPLLKVWLGMKTRTHIPIPSTKISVANKPLWVVGSPSPAGIADSFFLFLKFYLMVVPP